MAIAAERQVAFFGGAGKKLFVRRISGAETPSSLTAAFDCAATLWESRGFEKAIRTIERLLPSLCMIGCRTNPLFRLTQGLRARLDL